MQSLLALPSPLTPAEQEKAARRLHELDPDLNSNEGCLRIPDCVRFFVMVVGV